MTKKHLQNRHSAHVLSSPAQKLIEKIKLLDKRFPGLLHREFLDWIDAALDGVTKYGVNTWLITNCPRMDRKSNHDSMGHHWADSMVGNLTDKDSGLHPALHLACRAMYQYIRDIRKLKHPED